jgi:hypothetical protein
MADSSPAADPHTSRRSWLIRIAALASGIGAVAWRQTPSAVCKLIFPALAGDAMIIQLPNRQFGLIDGGSDATALAVELGRWLPFWQRDLAFMLLTLPDARHLPGQLGALQRYQVARVYAAPAAVAGRGSQWRQWNILLQTQNLRPYQLQTNKPIGLGGVQLHTMAVDDTAVLLRLRYGQTSVVFAHASSIALEQTLALGRIPVPDVLVFPWQRDPHTVLIETLRPRWIHFSDGQQEKEPARLTYAERAIDGAQLSHTAVDGAVVWASDGVRSWREDEQGHF